MKGDNLYTISVAELREMLEDHNDEDLVVFQYDYGDYHHTKAVGGIEVVEVRPLEPNAYSHSGWAVKEDDPDEGEDEEEEDEPKVEGPRYVVLAGN